MKIEPLLKRMFKTGAEMESMVTLKSDASSRRYHRITMKGGVEPSSIIVMELPEDSLKSDEATGGEAPAELPFLNVGRYLGAAGLPVPEVYLDAVADGAVLLEDLGDETFAIRVGGCDQNTLEDWYGAAVDLMVSMHRDMWPVAEGCQAAGRCFDYELLRWELDHYREWGAEALSGNTLEPGLRSELDRVFDDLAGEIAALPQGFVHRDYQSRNLMVTGDVPAPSSLSIIDFQDALLGPRAYDLVALLNDSYVYVPHDMQIRTIERYALARGLDPRVLCQEFDLITVQRKLKDGGRFVFIDRVKNNPSFLPFVDKSFGRVRAALSRIGGHDDLKKTLHRVDPQRF